MAKVDLQLGRPVPIPASPDQAILDRVPNAHPDAAFVARFTAPEFTSICPVTGQPDFGDVMIRYRGSQIERAALLRYLISYRRHPAFHESCVERMFVDVLARCAPRALTVYARFLRRGGIDINPFRSNFESAPDSVRSARQ